MSDLLTGEIIGAAIEVHKTLGRGLLESIYEEALCYELELREIKFQRQLDIDVIYKGRVLGSQKIDLLVGDEVIVKIESQPKSLGNSTPQVVSTLKAAGLQRALIFNFGANRLIDGTTRIVI
ncbi:MAG: GxxExxY protein [Acidobacteriota bacterium]|nr:GxxExxY protein [Acidobacteriota bacterium]